MSFMQNRYSPLRYPGGKGKMTEYIRLLFETNQLNDGHYVEPYAGGAAVALALLFLENASRIHINDLNRAVYAFWHTVLYETDALCKKIFNAEVTIKEWLVQKEIHQNKDTASLLELGYATFFLNRTNRSGIINGGVIGGNQQTGQWKIDARFNKKDLISRIEKIALFANRIDLYNLDACDFLKKITPTLPPQTLIYLDPPYYAKGKGLYQAHYKNQDHAILGEWIQNNLKHPWIVSYDDLPPIREIYCQRRQQGYAIGYSARNIYAGSEVMIYSDNMLIPDVINPLKLTA